MLDSVGDRRSGCHVVNERAGRGGKLPVRHLGPEDRPDQLLLRALRIPGGQCEDLDTRRCRPAQRCGGVRLVVLESDDRARCPDRIPDDLRTAHDAVRGLDHQAIVAGEIGLALTPVQDDGCDLSVFRRRKLDRTREGRAAHSHHTRGPHERTNIGSLGPHERVQVLQLVGNDRDRGDPRSGGRQGLADAGNLAIDRAMHGR